MALRAGLLDREEALLHAYLTGATTGGAGLRLRARLGARTMADLALFHERNADRLLGAACGFLQRDLQVVAQVGAAVDIGAPTAATAAATTEDLVEDAAEGIRETLEARAAAKATGAACGGRIYACMTIAVVRGALVAVGEHFVGLFGLLEFLFGAFVVGVAVRVELHRELAIGLLDVLVAGVAIDPQYVVVIPFGHLLFSS